MAEYALILAAIAVVVYGVYAAMGNNIGSLTSAAMR
jgi:Flp pilus assembly pilin Flp